MEMDDRLFVDNKRLRKHLQSLMRRKDRLEKRLASYAGPDPVPANRELSAVTYAINLLLGVQAGVIVDARNGSLLPKGDERP